MGDIVKELKTTIALLGRVRRILRECKNTITALLAENKAARAVLDRIDEIAKAADAAPLCMGEIRQLIEMHRAKLEDTK